MQARPLNVQMKTAVFKSTDPISVLSFLGNFNTACDSNNIHEDAAVQLYPHFIREPTQAALSYRVTADKQNLQQQGKVKTYCRVVNYSSEKYATEEAIVEIEAKITSSKEPASINAVCYSIRR